MPGTPAISIDMQQTDDTYWQVFDFALSMGNLMIRLPLNRDVR